jgi:hypothetical protein
VTKVLTHGRKGTQDYFRTSGVLREVLNHTPFLAFVINGDIVDIRIVESARALVMLPPDTQVMAQWRGKYRSDFFQFTVRDVLKAMKELGVPPYDFDIFQFPEEV